VNWGRRPFSRWIQSFQHFESVGLQGSGGHLSRCVQQLPTVFDCTKIRQSDYGETLARELVLGAVARRRQTPAMSF